MALATADWQSLAYDELFTVWVASQPWSDLIPQANLDGFTPPSFYALIKLATLFGLRNEGLRLVPVAFGAMAVFLGIEAARRRFGRRGALISFLVIPSSSYVFTFSHELRPYSALLAFGMAFLGCLGGEPSNRKDHLALVAAFVGSLFSYLGLFMVALWMFEARARISRRRLLAVATGASALALPALLKVAAIKSHGAPGIPNWTNGLSPSSILFGLAPAPFDGRLAAALIAALVVALLLAASLTAGFRSGRISAEGLLVRACVLWSVMVAVIDGAVPIGFAPRYFVLPMAAFLLLLAGRFACMRRLGVALALLVAAGNLISTSRYLTRVPAAREDWRQALARVQTQVGSDGVVLAFPFHHGAVAASAYAPRLKVGGGYTSRSGPVYWYEPPTLFRGYSFEDLRPIQDVRASFGRVASESNVCLLSDEPDPAKTAGVFDAFAQLDRVSVLDAGDPRIRILCRSKV